MITPPNRHDNIVAKDGKCLTASHNEEYAAFEDCKKGALQQWEYVHRGFIKKFAKSGQIALKEGFFKKNKCLKAPWENNHFLIGNRIPIVECDKHDIHQSWSFPKVEHDAQCLVLRNTKHRRTKQCVGIREDFGYVNVSECNGKTAQMWVRHKKRIHPASDKSQCLEQSGEYGGVVNYCSHFDDDAKDQHWHYHSLTGELKSKYRPTRNMDCLTCPDPSHPYICSIYFCNGDSDQKFDWIDCPTQKTEENQGGMAPTQEQQDEDETAGDETNYEGKDHAYDVQLELV